MVLIQAKKHTTDWGKIYQFIYHSYHSSLEDESFGSNIHFMHFRLMKWSIFWQLFKTILFFPSKRFTIHIFLCISTGSLWHAMEKSHFLWIVVSLYDVRIISCLILLILQKRIEEAPDINLKYLRFHNNYTKYFSPCLIFIKY